MTRWFYSMVCRGVLLGTLLAAAAGNIDAAEAPCADDPRLAQLPDLLKNNQPIAGPLRLTVETFLRLNPDVAARLHDVIRICPDSPVSPKGNPLFPLEVPFYLLREQITICANAQDWAGVERLRRYYRAAPLPAVAIPSLLMQPAYHTADKRKLADATGTQLRMARKVADGGNARLGVCTLFLYSDLFRALGGKVPDAGKILVFDEEAETFGGPRKIRELAMRKGMTVIFVNSAEAIIQSLNALGFTTLHVGISGSEAIFNQLLKME